MLRSVAKQVAWVGKTASMVFGLALVMALVFGVATMALGATGGNFLLGQRNVADAISTLVRQGPGPALSLVVEANQPPLRVNSAARVANLNSDKLDGLDSTQLKAVGRSTRGGNCTADAGTQTCTQTTVDLPAPGRVLLNSTGSWLAFEGFPASGILTGHCVLKEAGSLEDISETSSFVGERQSAAHARSTRLSRRGIRPSPTSRVCCPRASTPSRSGVPRSMATWTGVASPSPRLRSETVKPEGRGLTSRSSPGPSSCPYSPKCVEEATYEVRSRS